MLRRVVAGTGFNIMKFLHNIHTHYIHKSRSAHVMFFFFLGNCSLQGMSQGCHSGIDVVPGQYTLQYLAPLVDTMV